VSSIGNMDLAEMINLDIHEEDDDLDVPTRVFGKWNSSTNLRKK
jgi:hypothetical protein